MFQAISRSVRFVPRVYRDLLRRTKKLPLYRPRDASEQFGRSDETTALITRLLLFYLVLLATNLIGHWIAFTIFDARLSEKSLVNLDIVFTAFFESVDTVIVLIAFFKIPVERSAWPPWRDASTWLACRSIHLGNLP